MTASRASIRYAKAALELAQEQKSLEAVSNDMVTITNILAEHKGLRESLQNPVVRSSDKKEVLNKVLKGQHKITNSLINTLIANRRINLLADVATKFNQLYDELRGTQIAKVTTAVPLTKDLKEKVLKKVKELTSKEVELENIIDASILGGFILRVGDIQYNASIANKLNKLKREFTLN
ncbi:MAG: ATP synthase F1 subunit delta [Winogradskyella sp.]|nr:ATP synthase F1 subunit delta [Winogradskyella sp.]NNF85461.1 ATP synthase F1 subunit delta [Winogradskyella sp.]NNK39082.1 ATP synthase F1 subunit delta [Winogradskyella sp.]